MNDFESQWEAVRAKGKLRFLIVQGLLCWGLPMALVMTGYLHLLKKQPLDLTLKLTVPIFLIGGLLWASVLWFFLDRKYTNLTRK